MLFLVDESLGKRFASLVKNAGYDVIFAGDVIPEADDEKVLAHAEREKRVLITADKDFGELIFSLGKFTYGVILLRILTRDPEKRFEIVKDILDKAEGKFIVVKESGIRIREL